MVYILSFQIHTDYLHITPNIEYVIILISQLIAVNENRKYDL